MTPMWNVERSTPKRIPHDHPLGSFLFQIKSLPAHKFFRNGEAKFLLPVSEIAIKLRSCSFVRSDMCFFGSLKPLQF
jgi:hypothetical protein